MLAFLTPVSISVLLRNIFPQIKLREDIQTCGECAEKLQQKKKIPLYMFVFLRLDFFYLFSSFRKTRNFKLYLIFFNMFTEFEFSYCKYKV